MRYRTSLVGSAHFVFDEFRKWPMACLLLATIGLRPQNPSETKAEISGFSWRYSFLARIWKLWDFTVTRCIRGIGKGPSQHWNNNLHNMFYFWWRFWSGIYILFAEHQPADILDSCVFFGRYLCVYIYNSQNLSPWELEVQSFLVTHTHILIRLSKVKTWRTRNVCFA